MQEKIDKAKEHVKNALSELEGITLPENQVYNYNRAQCMLIHARNFLTLLSDQQTKGDADDKRNSA